jgi:hypothetical protein
VVGVGGPSLPDRVEIEPFGAKLGMSFTGFATTSPASDAQFIAMIMAD